MTRAPHSGPRPRRRTTTAVIASTVGLALLASCGSDGAVNSDGKSSPSVTQVGPTVTSGEAAPTGEAPAVQATLVATVEEPTILTPRPGDDDHLWVAERGGTVRILDRSASAPGLEIGDVVLDISEDTSTDAERGLLGLTFSEDGAQLYVSYTNAGGDSRVAQYDVDGEGADATVDEGSRRELLFVSQPFPNHNGGYIALGPDGDLWLGLGDGGSSDDPDNRAQDPDEPLGKMLRIDLDSGESEIVVLGVRNPWRWAFDDDGSLWIADVGQNAIEEIDHLPAGEIDGANLGWSGYEGTAEYLDGDGRRPLDAVPPVFEYTHDDGNCSITGGFAYHGTAIDGLDGAFLFADYCAGQIRAISLGDDGVLAQEFDLGINITNPISFGQDQDGEPYVLSADGTITLLAPAA